VTCSASPSKSKSLASTPGAPLVTVPASSLVRTWSSPATGMLLPLPMLMIAVGEDQPLDVDHPVVAVGPGAAEVEDVEIAGAGEEAVFVDRPE
jgi:hypothetical protein